MFCATNWKVLIIDYNKLIEQHLLLFSEDKHMFKLQRDQIRT